GWLNVNDSKVRLLGLFSNCSLTREGILCRKHERPVTAPSGRRRGEFPDSKAGIKRFDRPEYAVARIEPPCLFFSRAVQSAKINPELFSIGCIGHDQVAFRVSRGYLVLRTFGIGVLDQRLVRHQPLPG